MKNIVYYDAHKYKISSYKCIEGKIYKHLKDNVYRTSIQFEQEEQYGEGTSAADISDYPLNAVLDTFHLVISDKYINKNTSETQVCTIEVQSDEFEDLERFTRNIMGKHVFIEDNAIKIRSMEE